MLRLDFFLSVLSKENKNFFFLKFFSLFFASLNMIFFFAELNQMIISKRPFELTFFSLDSDPSSVYFFQKFSQKDFWLQNNPKTRSFKLLTEQISISIEDEILSEQILVNKFSNWKCSLNETYFEKSWRFLIFFFQRKHDPCGLKKRFSPHDQYEEVFQDFYDFLFLYYQFEFSINLQLS